MATVKDSIPHIIRTADDPRQQGIWSARLSRIELVNSTVRLLRLSLPRDGPPLRHLPGQYIDLYIPNVDVVGGFTITSPPQTSLSSTNSDPYIELAIQCSPGNPPAAFLWRPPAEILDARVTFRIGGTFIYPPLTLGRDACARIDRAVFVAGGVGINPIMSMISAMDAAGAGGRPGGMVKRVRLLYSSRRGRDEKGKKEEVLFEKRLREIAEKWRPSVEVDYSYTFFETSSSNVDQDDDDVVQYRHRRIKHEDLLEALGPENERENTVVYICGLPTMTDEFVDLLQSTAGFEKKRVLCEKWW